ncbi:MAG: BamA/TamA family outer membrane protein [bacterium]|nr:BamA/TamA family outer membrane protein [bacterium]
MIAELVAATILLCGSAAADEAPADGEKKGGGYRFLPIPVFITEPAIGEGLGVALTMFHPPKQGAGPDDPKASTPQNIGKATKASEPPPVVTGLLGAYTSNGTWALGVGHMNHWRGDSIRYAAAAGVVDVTSDFYADGTPIEFELEGNIFYQDLDFRVGKSRFLVGTGLQLLDAENTFDLGPALPLPPDFLTSDLRQVGISLAGTFEGRDNTTMPTKGQYVDWTVWRFDEAFGSDFDYWSTTLKFLSFHALSKRFNLDLRAQATGVNGRAPFFGYPWITLRGIPALRYQDELIGELEAQLRFLAAKKWIVLAFAGTGFTNEHLETADEGESIYAGGVGSRFNVFKDQNIWVGIDIARGPEEWAWYVQVNHPW